MPDKLVLPSVALVGTGGLFYQNDRAMWPLKFKCPFGVKIAKAMGCEDAVYEKVNGTVKRRPVAEIKLLTKFEGADLQFVRVKDFPPDSLRAEKLCNFTVVNENERTELYFQAHVASDEVALVAYMNEQKKEPCDNLTIIGDQRELEFSGPKRGRPKKEKDKPAE